MAAEHDYVDIEDDPKIVDLARRARETGRAIEIREAGNIIGVFQPIPTQEPHLGQLTEEDHDAFRKTAGAWKGIVDADALKEWIAERRRMPSRPRVKL
jgi:hypothetical protein